LKILITGGAGFIGSHLAERLLSQGHEVTVVDRVEPPSTVTGWIKGDCRDMWIGALHGKPEFDFIYHLAATVGVKRVLADPAECIANNIDSLRMVLSFGVPGLFTSTSEVYGKNKWTLKEDSPIEYSSKNRWCYAASKLIGEWMCKQAGWKVVRLFNVVGPRQSSSYGAVLPQFIRQAIAHEPLTIYGDGKQTRTFIHVKDCVEILDKLRDKEFDVVNVGGTHIYSIEDLAALIADMHGRNPVEYIPYSTVYADGFEECPTRIPDLTKLDSLLPVRTCRSMGRIISDIVESLPSKFALQKV
jgi:UDP-glucose 4-epimerase